jgi:hypothetical protein
VTVTPGRGMLPLFTAPCSLPPATTGLAAGGVACEAAAGAAVREDGGALVEFGADAGLGAAAGFRADAGLGAGAGACAQTATQLDRTIPVTPARIIIFAVRPLVPVLSLTSHAARRFTDYSGRGKG